MKIGVITVGLYLTEDDFIDIQKLERKFDLVSNIFQKLTSNLKCASYDILENRISTNTIEDWLLPYIAKSNFTVELALNILLSQLKRISVNACSFSCATNLQAFFFIPAILASQYYLII